MKFSLVQALLPPFLCTLSRIVSLEIIPTSPTEEQNWLTGSILAPTIPLLVDPGNFNIQTTVFWTFYSGSYDRHWKFHSTSTLRSLDLNIFAEIGMLQKMDCQIILDAFYNSRQGVSSTRFGDSSLALNFELYKDRPHHWVPYIKLSLQETFPTGKYQKLNPHKKQTDISGLGSFQTTADFIFAKVIHFTSAHYFTGLLSLAYTMFSPVHVKGLNAYGGGFKTNGKVYPGNLFNVLTSFEYSLTQNWALALDINASFWNKTRFSGKRGFNEDGSKATMGSGAAVQISFAPAIEYNFNENLGIEIGSWFTAFGRNSDQFASAVFLLSYYR